MRALSTRTLVLIGLAISVLLAVVLSHYASSHPDGLEYVAEKTGFIGTAEESVVVGGPAAGYQVRGVESPRLSGGLAGLLGVAVTALAAFGLFALLRKR